MFDTVDNVYSILNKEYLASLFLLLLTISGNFMAETFSCQVRKLLTNNMFAKHILLIFLIYFTTNLQSDVGNPYIKLKRSIMIWILFVLFSKMNIYFTIIVFLLFASIFIMNNFIYFYDKRNNQDDIKKRKLLTKYVIKTEIAMIIILITGFITYLIKQINEKKQFSYLTFIFGQKTCDNI